MKNYSLSKRNGILIIIAFWLVYFLIDFISNGLLNLSNKKSFFATFSLFVYTMYIVQLLTILFNYFVLVPKFLKHITWKNIFITLISSFTFFILIRYLIEQILTNIFFNSVNYYDSTPFLYYVIDNFHFASFIVFSSLFLWIVIHLIQTIEANRIIEKEKKDAEINFLKAQINPHFLFNTLNNIYSLVNFKPDLALKSIENLGSIMRFTTYETNKNKIEIRKEIEYIEQYLALEKIRFGEKFFIEKSVKIDNENQLIYPFLISPLIENALKHGVVKDQDFPIIIEINQNNNQIDIRVKNKINSYQKDTLTGIGLDNFKKRLTYYFKNDYQFIINNDDDFFEVNLKFPLYE